MLTRMAPSLTRMARIARLLTRMTRWLAGSHIIHTQFQMGIEITRNMRIRNGFEEFFLFSL